ncbi:DUF998 domain-containing protein [Herbidospora mongoliensis]|uniref:DUF998 domain-containing protein n=1 Tax=Herbidospora mongoliensis TaxID=688067 RepID=UPI000835CC81|nr:DUF998 domain-containing protein [Herbidospora mongoliensis]
MRVPAQAGLGAIFVAAAAILTLEYSSGLDLARRTISEHQLGEYAWLFAASVALIAAGSLGIGVTLMAQRRNPVGIVALFGWSLGLLIVAIFPKHNWALGPSIEGTIHRAGSVLAFVCLPIAVLLLAHPWRDTLARIAALLGLGAVVWIAGIASVAFTAARDGIPWWRAMPIGLGAVERGLVFTEMAALAALGVWAIARQRHPA